MLNSYAPRIHWPIVWKAVLWVILTALILFIIWYVLFIYVPAIQRQKEAERLLQVEIEVLRKHGLTELPTSTVK